MCLDLYRRPNHLWTHPARSAGDIASFGAYIFGVLSAVQLVIVIAASLIFSAGSVAQEKDRRTLILLLMTDLRATELVLGKSLASALPVISLIAVSVPVLCCLRMLGGVTISQIVWVEVICLASCLAASAWGTLVGYWREKTFQILAITLLGAGLFMGLAETAAGLAGAGSIAADDCSLPRPVPIAGPDPQSAGGRSGIRCAGRPSLGIDDRVVRAGGRAVEFHLRHGAHLGIPPA